MHGSVAQMFGVVVGVLLSLLGIVSLIVNADFSTGESISAERLLYFDVNGWSGVLYLLTGLVALFATADKARARTVAMAVGGLYLILTVWSLFDASILGLLPVNDLTAITYAAIGVIGVAGAMQPESEHSV
ncbi:MAG: DUF4383 domain-containing protein [Actinobacteria bacterium]|nr:DUF4383 domain-containing protein [Actinomycetota bacterium]